MSVFKWFLFSFFIVLFIPFSLAGEDTYVIKKYYPVTNVTSNVTYNITNNITYNYTIADSSASCPSNDYYFYDLNITNGVLQGSCALDSTSAGSGDGNNYTLSTSFNNTGNVYQLNTEITGRVNLTATFDLTSLFLNYLLISDFTTSYNAINTSISNRVLNETLQDNYLNASQIYDLIPSSLTYYFYNINDTINNSYKIFNTTQNPTEETRETTGLTDGQIIVYRVNRNANLSGISEGSVTLYNTLKKTGGTQNLKVYGVLSKLLANGSIYDLVTTTQSSELLLNEEVIVHISGSIPQTTLNTSDAILWRLIAYVYGSGTAPSLNVTIGGTRRSGVTLPVTFRDITITESDPVWLSEKTNYATTTEVSNRALNSSVNTIRNISSVGFNNTGTTQQINIELTGGYSNITGTWIDQTGGGTGDGNNYTNSISFNNTASIWQLNLNRTGMINLTAIFDLTYLQTDISSRSLNTSVATIRNVTSIGVNNTGTTQQLNLAFTTGNNITATWTDQTGGSSASSFPVENLTYDGDWVHSFDETDFDSLVATAQDGDWASAVVGTAGTQVVGTGDQWHIGVLNITSGTATNSGWRYYKEVTAYLLNGSECSTLIFMPRPDAGTTVTTLRFGFHDTATITSPVDGIYYEIKWNITNIISALGVTMSNSASTNTTFGVGNFSIGNWNRIMFCINSTPNSVNWLIYNSTKGNTALLTNVTLTSSNIPTAIGRETGQGVIVTSNASAVATKINLDYMSVDVKRRLVR